ncbi:hypothetical protein AKO1_006225 [Acrasis kona]|uniref:Uncharacterized protein n=1 Tax=Acrasis kona TaxID=1008807 RepID=A0AAW2YI14_9EUKA
MILRTLLLVIAIQLVYATTNKGSMYLRPKAHFSLGFINSQVKFSYNIVSDREINIYVVSMDNYENLQTDQRFRYYRDLSAENTLFGKASGSIPLDGHLVITNTGARDAFVTYEFSEDNRVNVLAIVLPIVLGLVLILFVALVIYVIRRKRIARRKYETVASPLIAATQVYQPSSYTQPYDNPPQYTHQQPSYPQPYNPPMNPNLSPVANVVYNPLPSAPRQ